MVSLRILNWLLPGFLLVAWAAQAQSAEQGYILSAGGVVVDRAEQWAKWTFPVNAVEIDSRTSDALAMAVRFDCPIYTYEFILDAAGVVLEDTEGSDEDEELFAVAPSSGMSDNPLASYSTEALTKMLDEVLDEENYEKAAQIRDEIERRRSS